MKKKENIFWFLFLLISGIHFVLLPLTILYSFNIISLEWLGATEYMKGYIFRLLSIVFVLVIVLLFAKKKKAWENTNQALILFFLSLGFLLDTLGNLWGFYDVQGVLFFPWYDDFAHFVVHILVAVSLLTYFLNIRGFSKKLSVLLSSSLSLSLIVLWELYEYFSDRLLGTTMVKNDLEDTMFDMVFGVLGTTVGCFLFFLFSKKQKEVKESSS